MNLPNLLLAIAASALLATSARAVTIDFEDLSGEGAVPSDYQGLTWTGWAHYLISDPPYDASSGVQRIYNERRDNNNLVEFPSPVTFEGLWLAGFSLGQYVIGYVGGVPTYTSPAQSLDLSEFGTLINVNWPGVDAISIHSEPFAGVNDYYIVDDIRYSTGGTSVPDTGSTLAALGLGIGAIGMICRRKA